MDEPKLKPSLKLMARYYIGEAAGSAEKAAVLAGYAPKYARGNAYKLVKREDFQQYLKYLDYLKNTTNLMGQIATIQDIQIFWTNVMNNKREETKDRIRASELLAKVQGAFNNDDW